MRMLTYLHQIECDVLLWTFVQREHRFVVPLAKALSRTGDGNLPVITLGVLFSLPKPMYGQIASQIVTLFIIERVVYIISKNSLRRRRPTESEPSFIALVIASDRFSFPSGHTSAATLYAAIMAMHFPHLAPLLLVWATGVGISRVILGVHYPSDILAGALLGVVIAKFA